MKIEFPKEWCLRMANLETETGIDFVVGPPQPEQEPVMWLTGCPECGMDSGCDCEEGTWNPPPQRPWVGLTEVDILAAQKHWRNSDDFAAGVDWAEATLKEKNT